MHITQSKHAHNHVAIFQLICGISSTPENFVPWSQTLRQCLLPCNINTSIKCHKVRGEVMPGGQTQGTDVTHCTIVLLATRFMGFLMDELIKRTHHGTLLNCQQEKMMTLRIVSASPKADDQIFRSFSWVGTVQYKYSLWQIKWKCRLKRYVKVLLSKCT